LRAISLVAFPIGSIPLLITGLATNLVNPAISILPLFFSAAYAALLLASERTCCGAAGLTGTRVHKFCDVLCSAGHLACLILTWVMFPMEFIYRRGEEGWLILGTYGSVFVIVDL
jgi:hypothetical protein